MAERHQSFVQPRSPVFWVFIFLTVYGLIRIAPFLFRDLSAFPLSTLFAATLWGAYAAALGLILYQTELFERRSPVTILGAFLWGSLVVSGIGVTASPAMATLVESVIPPQYADWVSAIAAPLTEEPLKMLGVIALAMIPGAHIRTTLDGLFYGLIVGLGFGVTESFLYTTSAVASQGGSMSVVLAVFVLRGFIGGLWNHPTFSAISGAGVGYFVESDRTLTRRSIVAGASLVVAMVLHGLFNSPLLSGLGVVGAIIKGVPALVMLIFVFRLARQNERSRFEHIAAEDIDHDLITDDERESLLYTRTRREERRRVRRSTGRAAAKRLRRTQMAQIDLVETAIDHGVGSDAYRAAARVVRESKTG